MGIRRSSLPSPRPVVGLALLLIAIVPVLDAGSGSAHGTRPGHHSQVREAVLRGVTRDFEEGTGIGGRSFRSCFEDGLREALDPPTIEGLVRIYRRQGPPYAAQELNRLGAPLAARCGRRAWVPELVDAAHGLSAADRPADSSSRAATLDVTYGPFLGIRCHAVGHRGCDMVGIDVVLADPASRVEAVVGDRRVRLRTPGEHDGARNRDWVGTFVHAGLGKPGSPFHFHAPGPVHVDVEVKATVADGSSARVTFHHVLLAPGWG